MELLKAELLATISHELRSPLASIKGYAATLLRHEQHISFEERHEFLLAINKSSDRLAILIDRLLEMSQLEMGTITPECVPVNLPHLMREAITASGQRLDGQRIIHFDGQPVENTLTHYTSDPVTFTLRVEDHEGLVSSEEPVIQADRQCLREAVDNLLENGILYSPHGGTVEVVVRPTTIKDMVSSSDDPQLLRLVARNLQLEDYDVLTASDGKQALELVEAHQPDLVLLDVMMPKMDGFSVCQRVREFSTVPIIIVTARGQDQDKIRGLDLGADDYLTKPFSVDELLARVRAVLRRTHYTTNENIASARTITTFGDLTIDFAQHLVTLTGKEVTLTPTEYRILSYLAQNAGRVVTQDLLLEHVWGSESVGESHMLQVNINRLRHKLEADPARPRYILTKVGIGYLLATQPDVQTIS